MTPSQLVIKPLPAPVSLPANNALHPHHASH